MARGGVVYQGEDTRNYALTDPGTAGQVLQSNGPDADPSWETVTGSGLGEVVGPGHLHGIQRMLGDGSTTTFNLLDFAEYLEHVGVNGAFVDPLTITLSSDRSQITFDSAPGDGHVITMSYVMAGL